MADVTITPSDNGPYIVRGEIDMVDAKGKKFETKGTTALCRCGASATKPFCDGSHKTRDFKSEVRAP